MSFIPRTIQFKDIYPTYEEFLYQMRETSMLFYTEPTEYGEEFFKVLFNRFANRWFKWGFSFEINARMEEYWNNNFPLYIKNKITWTTNQEKISGIVSNVRNYTVNSTTETEDMTSDKFLDSRQNIQQDNVNLVSLYTQQNLLQGYMTIAIKEAEKLFLMTMRFY